MVSVIFHENFLIATIAVNDKNKFKNNLSKYNFILIIRTYSYSQSNELSHLWIFIQNLYYFTNASDSNKFPINEVNEINRFIFISENDYTSSKRKSKNLFIFSSIICFTYKNDTLYIPNIHCFLIMTSLITRKFEAKIFIWKIALLLP